MSAPILWFGNAAKLLKSVLKIPGSTSGTLSLAAPSAITDYTITLPSAQGGANTLLQNDGSGNISFQTPTNVTATLSQFTSSLQGVVPGSGGGTTNFLRADGTWATPSGTGTPNSSVTNDTGNGYGSTNTVIRRFTNSVTVGTDITYADSATNGGSFTINTTGLYAISYSDASSASAFAMGISKNSNQLTTSIATITTANRLISMSTAGAQFVGAVAWTGKLTATDVIRAHTDGTTGTTGAQCQFTIVRIG